VLQRRHDQISTYGVGREYSAEQWRTLAQQWIQAGLLRQDMEHGGLALTEKGHAVLRGGQQVYAELEAPSNGTDGGRVGGRQAGELSAYDQGLFDELRRLRRMLAETANLPPYMVFSDRALIEMAAYLPRSDAEFVAINGVGLAKLQSYGAEFMNTIAEYSALHGLTPQTRRPNTAPAPAVGLPARPQGHGSDNDKGKGKRAQEVGELFAAGSSLANLQELYGVKRSTIVSHLRDHRRDGGEVDAHRLQGECLLPPALQEQVLAQFGALGGDRLAPIYEALEGTVDYEDLHLLRLVWLAQVGAQL
jgi:ATP-dependent DNA helicase RecQ